MRRAWGESDRAYQGRSVVVTRSVYRTGNGTRRQKSAEAVVGRQATARRAERFCNRRDPKTRRPVVRQKLLQFMEEGPDGGNERNSFGPSAASQAARALTEATTTAGTSLMDEVLHKETLTRAWKQVRANRGDAGRRWRDHRAVSGVVCRTRRCRDGIASRGQLPTPSGASGGHPEAGRRGRGCSECPP